MSKKYTINHKKIYIFVIIIVIVVSIQTTVFAFPVADYVNVSQVHAEQINWCWAASMKSCMAYHNTYVSQSYIVTATFGAPLNIGANEYEVIYGFNNCGFNAAFSSSANFATIQSEIYNYNRPFIAYWDLANFKRHAVVVRGYYDDSVDTVYYMDPYLYALTLTTYPAFKENYSHYWSTSIRSIY